MEFALPTTKEEMYATLTELFHYYRYQKSNFELVEQLSLKLDKIDYTVPDSETLRARAETLLDAEEEKEILALKKDINERIAKVNSQITSTTQNYDKLAESAKTLFEQSQTKLREQAVKNGLINTSAYLDKLTSLEKDKNEKLLSISTQKDNALAEHNATLTMLEESLTNADTYYSSLHEKRILAKVDELKEKADTTAREVFKYNNTLEIQMQTHENTIKRSNMSLYLKWMEANMVELTKDQLIDLGYYDDVVKCVCGYYDRMEPLNAYNDYNKEKRLTIFLEDYYSNVAYMYGLRAGVFTI